MPGSKNVATPSNSTAITLELTAAVPSVKCGGRAETLRATAKPKELTVNATFSQINNKAHDMHNFLAAVVKKPRARHIKDFEPRCILADNGPCILISARCSYSGLMVVLKGYYRSKLTARRYTQVMREVCNHGACASLPNVIALYAAFEDAQGLYLVMAYAPQGDLLSVMEENHRVMSEEKAVRSILQPLIQTLSDVHDMGIIHRDIKPENILMENDEVRLADFGLCINVNQECPSSRVGTYEYMAPEVTVTSDDPTYQRRGYLGRPAYTAKVDVWGVGVLLFDMLVGSTPFEGTTRDFILLTLRKNPKQRPVMRKLLTHPLLQKYSQTPGGPEPLLGGEAQWAISTAKDSSVGAVTLTELSTTAELAAVPHITGSTARSFARHVDCFSLPGEVAASSRSDSSLPAQLPAV
eukprot:jgi/Tetstr1/447678/TSEL_035036.t1